MRLLIEEIALIKKAFKETYKEGKIYLFGSRVDDTKRGGDIDLYLCPASKKMLKGSEKFDFLVKLDEYIGEQKIDVVIAGNKNRLIDQIAIRDGVLL